MNYLSNVIDVLIIWLINEFLLFNNSPCTVHCMRVFKDKQTIYLSYEKIKHCFKIPSYIFNWDCSSFYCCGFAFNFELEKKKERERENKKGEQ